MPLLRRLLLSTAAMPLLGVAAGFVWEWLANPAQWQVRERTIVMTESAGKDQFSVIVVFVLVGAVAALVWGALTAWTLRELGWVLTPLITALTVAGALIAWRVGVQLGPPDPSSVTNVSSGDQIPSQLAVDAIAPFFVWPIFGLIGLIGATWLRRSDDVH